MMFLQIFFKLVILCIFFPFLSSLIIGIFYRFLSCYLINIIALGTMILVTFVFFFALYFLFNNNYTFNCSLYKWGSIVSLSVFEFGFLFDKLSMSMIFVVSFISLMVHIYTVSYMKGDSGYKKFFCYILFFTFAMLLLVSSNNIFQLFLGWESVGLASYLLIGFWFFKETAIIANFKAFVINRISDLGLLLGLACIVFSTGASSYDDINERIFLLDLPLRDINIFYGIKISFFNFSCFCIFVGAMGKSAQVPFHVWLPDSMEGPTPISALIHAATMVTAGIFIVSRFSFLYAFASIYVLSFIMIVGSITCISMGILGIVQDDIKRIIAYSTLSQLGLMVAGLGVSAYSASMFHLITHAFFKALLFLCAGSVIIQLHHEQNIFKMGNLKNHLPITYVTIVLGSLSLAGFPGFSGFFSKDVLINCIKYSDLPLSSMCYYLTLCSIFFTSFYSFRLIFIVFHNSSFSLKMTKKLYHNKSLIKECVNFLTVPLIILAIFSVILGWLLVDYVLLKNCFSLNDNVFQPSRAAYFEFLKHYKGSFYFFLHGFLSIPFFFTILGLISSYIFYLKMPRLVFFFMKYFSFIYKILINKYFFDYINQMFVVKSILFISFVFWKILDQIIIDKFFIHGFVKIIYMCGIFIRHLQTGYLYQYIAVIIFCLFLLTFFIFHYLLIESKLLMLICLVIVG